MTGNDSKICSVHFKARSTKSMTDDGMGGMCCAPGSECKIGAGGSDLRNQYCTTHKKMRSAQSLVDDGAGGMTCAPGMECKEAKEERNARTREEMGVVSAAQCSVHHKMRSDKNL